MLNAFSDMLCCYVARGRASKDKCTFIIYLDANSLSNSKATANESGDDPASANGPHVQFSAKVLV